MRLGRYREVLGQQHVTRVLVTSMWARLPQGMMNLALILFLAPRVGYGRAGFAAGVAVAVGGVSNVAITRLIDQLGARAVVVPCAIFTAASLVALSFIRSGPYAVQVGLCAVAGLAMPPASSLARGIYSRLLDAEGLASIFGLEATVQEFVYIIGPTSVAILASLAGSAVALAATGVIGMTGTLALATSPAMPGRITRHDDFVRRFIGIDVLRFAFVGLTVVASFEMVAVAVVDFVGGKQASATSGFVLALWSVGSMVGGIWYAGLREVVTERRLTVAVVLLAAAIAVCAAAPDDIALAAILLIGGSTIAPCLARLYTLVGTAAPESRSTEAFGWIGAGTLIGAAIGTSVGGVSVDALGSRMTFGLAGITAVIGIAAIWQRQEPEGTTVLEPQESVASAR